MKYLITLLSLASFGALTLSAAEEAKADKAAAEGEKCEFCCSDTELTNLLPDKLTNAKGEEVPLAKVKDKFVGVYFSAHWCPPCRAFTPTLVSFRDKNKEEVEIVFVSFDKNEEAMKGYMDEDKMQWLAMPYDKAKAQEAAKKYEVRGIPTLIIFAPDGSVLTKNGRADVAADPEKALEKWKAEYSKKAPKEETAEKPEVQDS